MPSHSVTLLRASTTALLMLVWMAGTVIAGEVTDAAEKLQHELLPETGTDYSKALSFLRPLAEQGNVVAQYLFGVMYASGRGVPQSFAEAAKWYRLSALQGFSVAQYHLGLLYDLGYGLGKNDGEAAKWYRLAAERGHAEAQFNLGCMYDDGRGVPKDAAEAAKWYLRAAHQGVDRAQFKLAYMYREGRGVPQDRVRAHMWFLVQKFVIDTEENRMTPAQIIEAEKTARAWEPKPEFDNFEVTPK